MTRLLPAALLLLLACRPAATPPDAPPAADQRPAQMVEFRAVDTPEAHAAAHRAAEAALVEEIVLHRCTADRSWCAELVPDGESWRLELVDRTRSAAERRIRFEPPDRDVGNPHFALWPQLVREPGGAVTVGLLASRRAGFSGGGGLATRLILVRLEPAASRAAEILTVPVEGSALVRACFSEADIGLRREACHDEYELEGTLTLAPEPQAGRPRFLLTTRARTYPGEVERWEDSAERPPLRESDLVWADHRGCSYRRTFAFDPAAGRYAADAPLPDCGQFLVGEQAVADEAPPD